MKRFIGFIPLLFFVLTLKSQDFDKAKMDELFSVIENNNRGMGSVSIFQNGEEVYHRSIGYGDVEAGKKADAGTKYRIGSISKTFTAAIVLQLVDEKKVTLETKLSEYYPELPNAEKISVELLLRHRSGLYNFTNSPAYLTWMEAPKTEQELLNIFIKNGTVFTPGEKYEYSNTNYVLLSFIVEKLEKKPFSEVFDERITKALNLADTYYGGHINPNLNEANSYRMADHWEMTTETDMSIPLGAGAIVSTPTDLNRFFYALFHGKVITEESLSQMTNLVDGYGFGLMQIPFYERKAFGHNGGIDGFQSNASYFPVDDVNLAYTTNGTVMGLNDILIGVLSIYFGKEYNLPTFTPAIQVTSAELDQYLGVYSSSAMPLKITISKNENQLIAQATGQGAFPLEPYEKDKFRFEQAGIKMEFIPEDKKMILIQGARYEFKMDEQ